jgi:2-hydroxychromene-2-carboxylate isomerase
VEQFARAVYAGEFGEGADVADVRVLARCARDAGLDPAELRAAIQRDAIKDELRRATDAAWEAGVRGVPTLIRGGVVYYGDDQLELAAAAGA